MKTTLLEKLIDTALRNKFWVIFLSIGFLLLTIYKVNELSVDAVPDITNVQVVISTKTQGLDPEKVELTVTQPIEYEMMGIPELQDMRSISKFGLSQITLIFKDSTNIYWARQQVSEKLVSATGQLPEGVQPELAAITTGLGEVYFYALNLKENSPKKSLSHMEQMLYLREIQDFTVRPFLRKIRDVADVDSNGGYKKELHINIDPKKMISYGLTIDKVQKRLEGLGESYGGGTVVFGKEALIIKSSTVQENVSDFNKIILGQMYNGKKIFLSDIAVVSIDGAPRLGSATYEGEETVMGTILMKSGGNGRLVSLDVEEGLKSLKLPDDVEIRQLYSRAFLVNTTLTTVAKNLSEGAVLVVLILLVLLGHLRAALIVSLVIPLSMLGTTLGMQTINLSGNLMSLGAIDFGLVVDGAVVLVESLIAGFYSLSPEERKTLTKYDIVRLKAKDVMRPVVFGVCMIMLVYLPILLLEGTEGKMFRPMAWTVLMTLGWSLLLTIFLVPVLVSLFIRIPEETDHEHDTFIFRKLKSFYSPILNKVIDLPKPLMAGGLALCLLGVFVSFRMGTDFIPQLDEGDSVFNITRNSRISLDEALREQYLVDKAVKEIPEVELVFSRLGTPESASDPMGVHLTDMFVMLKKDRSKWTVKTKEEIVDRIKEKILSLGLDQKISSTQPIEMRFNEMLEGSRADLSLRIYGNDLSYMVDAIDNYAEKVSRVQGIEDAEMDALTALRKSSVIDIRPKFDELAKLGIPLTEFNNTIVSFMQGSQIGNWLQGTRKFPIRVHLSEELRDNLEEIQNLPVALPEEGSVTLKEIATINKMDQVTTIARNWGQRYAALSINIGDRDTMSFVGDVQKILKENPVREDHRLQLGGQFKNLERARLRLMIIIPLTLILILFILWREFGQMKDALIIFLCVPFAAIGGIFALYLRDIHFSLSAAVGFIALIGIALLNGIVLLTVFHQLRDSGKKIRDVVLEGTLSRLRPVVMTALVASLGFIPMAMNSGLGSEVQKPLATVVIGGILFSTVLTLLIFPSVYLYFHRDTDR